MIGSKGCPKYLGPCTHIRNLQEACLGVNTEAQDSLELCMLSTVLQKRWNLKTTSRQKPTYRLVSALSKPWTLHLAPKMWAAGEVISLEK